VLKGGERTSVHRRGEDECSQEERERVLIGGEKTSAHRRGEDECSQRGRDGALLSYHQPSS
jgi:hypothetical protein